MCHCRHCRRHWNTWPNTHRAINSRLGRPSSRDYPYDPCRVKRHCDNFRRPIYYPVPWVVVSHRYTPLGNRTTKFRVDTRVRRRCLGVVIAKQRQGGVSRRGPGPQTMLFVSSSSSSSSFFELLVIGTRILYDKETHASGMSCVSKVWESKRRTGKRERERAAMVMVHAHQYCVTTRSPPGFQHKHATPRTERLSLSFCFSQDCQVCVIFSVLRQK